MFTVKKLTKVSGLVLTAALALQVPVAQAAPIGADLSVDASVTLDTGFTSNGSGTLDLTLGGSSLTTAYPPATGINSLPGSFSDLGDGMGFTGTASATADDTGPAEFAIGIDSLMTIENISLSNSYKVNFKLSYSNSVNSAGDIDGYDAYADSELTLGSNGGFDDVFFSDLVSDTLNGNEVGGSFTGDFGGIVSESGDFLFDFTLNPSEILDLEMSWTLEGGDYMGFGASANLSAFVSIESVELLGTPPTPVPLPATLLLVGLGLFLMPLQRRMRAAIG